MVKRNSYIKKLLDYKDKHVIKVLTGMRRCGKSTLLMLYMEELKKLKVSAKNIIYLNLENPELMINDYKDLYNYINKQTSFGMNYVFIDEVQNIDSFEKAIDGLYLKENIDIYITGSNAKMLSSEISTILTGRYIEINVASFSFSEYASAYDNDNDDKLFWEYVECGGMPQLIQFDNKDNKKEYLSNVIATIVNKDILQRLDEKNKIIIESLLRYLMSNVGNYMSIKKITDAIISSGRKIGIHTIENYVQSFVDSFILQKVDRFDLTGKEILKTQNKYYASDVGLINVLIGKKAYSDIGHIIENIVYNELFRREREVYIGKLRNCEIDFITKGEYGLKYYQVAYDIKNKETLDREISALCKVKDNYEKYLLSYDVKLDTEYEGIKIIDLVRWLKQ